MTRKTRTAARVRAGKLKVIGCGTGTSRKICAVRSQKEFAKKIGESLHFVQGYACETGNAEEIALAMSKPGKLFVQPYQGAGMGEWRDGTKNDG